MIFGIDPGPHTAIVRYDLDKNEFCFRYFDFTPTGINTEDPHDQIYAHLRKAVIEGDTIVCEKFEWQKEKQERGVRLDYDAAEYVGVVKLFCQQYSGIKLVMQSPAEAVGNAIFWSDDKLRRVGLYRPIKHERDALRHLLKYLTFTLGDHRFLRQLKQA